MTVAYAHTLSASRSELRVEDGLTRLTIYLPVHELDHLPQADRGLARHFRIADEVPVSQSCRQEGAEWVCRATFLGVPGTVECTLAQVTVPNHIHTMRVNQQTLVFTNIVTRQQATAPVQWPLWLFGLAVVAAVAWLIRSLRSRRNRPA